MPASIRGQLEYGVASIWNGFSEGEEAFLVETHGNRILTEQAERAQANALAHINKNIEKNRQLI